MPSIEMWGGVECTINRVGDRYFDQLDRCGHYTRLSDLDAIASLGIKTLRYPALWERIAPESLASADWRWCDEALGRLRALGIDPIVGLLHHGSGPSGTHLLDPAFPARFAAYAAAFAERYPWVTRFTPVNEPLTTARFAALYGHWYPHRRDDKSFIAALLNQCVAIAEAMDAIRQRVPAAQLVQTEDAGSVRGRLTLAEQIAFESERCWLSLDLLSGKVDHTHPLWKYLRTWEADEAQLARLRERPATPDIVGLNYYVTSDRYLDDRLDRYPVETHGGNGRQRYADVEAVRRRGTDAWTRRGAPRGMAALPAASGHHRSASGLHARRADALARGGMGRRPRGRRSRRRRARRRLLGAARVVELEFSAHTRRRPSLRVWGVRSPRRHAKTDGDRSRDL